MKKRVLVCCPVAFHRAIDCASVVSIQAGNEMGGGEDRIGSWQD